MGGADRGSESETGADVVPSPHEPRRAAGAYDFPVDLGDLASAPGLIARHVPPGATVLDVGCASANLLVALRTDRGCPGVGLEIDSDAVAAARAKDVEVHDTDLAQDPLGRHLDGRRFDRVILADVLEHLVDPASVLGQVPGLLAPGGQVLVSVPNITHVDVILALAQDRFAYTPTGLLDRTHLRFFTLATFTEMAEACGLAVVGVERHIAPPLQTELWGGQSDLPRRYVAMLEQAVRAGNPNADVYQFIVVLEPRSLAVAEASESGPVGRPDSTPELTLIRRGAAGRASPAEPARAAVEPPAPEGAAPIQWVRLDPARPFGPALLAALDGVQGRTCAVVDDGAACDPALLHALRRAVQSDPDLVAACSGPVAADDLAPTVARAPGDAVTTALPRWARARLLTTPSLPLHGLVVRSSALRLAVQSVAALGPPFLAALDDWTVVARLLQWGDVGVLSVGAPGPGAPAPPPESDLPLAIAVSLSPLRPDEIMPPAPRAADAGAVPTPLVSLGPSPSPSRRSWLRRGPKP